MNYHNSKRYLGNHVADGEKLVKMDMRGTRAAGSKWVKCTFDSCHFDASAFAGALLDRCTLVNCTFQNSSFVGATILESEIRLCDLIQCDFSGAFIKQTEFPDCELEYATFFDATLNAVSFENAVLTGAILLYAAQTGVDYTGANLHDAAFKFGCKFFRGAKFDESHWHMFQSLIGYAEGLERVHPAVMATVNPRMAKLVDTLVERGHEN